MIHPITKILEKNKIEYEIDRNSLEVKIKCFSGLHEDNNPSLRFNLEKSVFNCFACGFSGSYAKLLKHLGEAPDTEVDNKQIYKLKKLRNKLDEKYLKQEIVIPSDAIKFNFDFKGIDSSTIKEFGAFTTNKQNLSEYICFPIFQYGKLQFIEARYKLLNVKTSNPKYLRKPANVQTKNILFPIDKIENKNHLILVEGLFDMLNLWQHGYKNTVCIFGTTNFKETKAKVVDNIGVKKVTIFMDNDASGKKASENIKMLLEKKYIETVTITPPFTKDPGDLTKKELEQLLGKPDDI